MRANVGGSASSSLSSPLSLRELVSSGVLEKIRFALADDSGNIISRFPAAGEPTGAAGSEADTRRLRLFQLNTVELFLLLTRTVSDLAGGPGNSSGTIGSITNLDCRNITIEFKAEFDDDDDYDDYQVGLLRFPFPISTLSRGRLTWQCIASAPRIRI